MYPFVSDVAWRPKEEDARVPRGLILKCKCGMRYWHQKNLGWIGARTIYNFPGGCEFMHAAHNMPAKYEGVDKYAGGVVECSCPLSDLEIDEELMEHIAHCEECQAHGY